MPKASKKQVSHFAPIEDFDKLFQAKSAEVKDFSRGARKAKSKIPQTSDEAAADALLREHGFDPQTLDKVEKAETVGEERVEKMVRAARATQKGGPAGPVTALERRRFSALAAALDLQSGAKTNDEKAKAAEKVRKSVKALGGIEYKGVAARAAVQVGKSGGGEGKTPVAGAAQPAKAAPAPAPAEAIPETLPAAEPAVPPPPFMGAKQAPQALGPPPGSFRETKAQVAGVAPAAKAVPKRVMTGPAPKPVVAAAGAAGAAAPVVAKEAGLLGKLGKLKGLGGALGWAFLALQVVQMVRSLGQEQGENLASGINRQYQGDEDFQNMQASAEQEMLAKKLQGAYRGSMESEVNRMGFEGGMNADVLKELLGGRQDVLGEVSQQMQQGEGPLERLLRTM